MISSQDMTKQTPKLRTLTKLFVTTSISTLVSLILWISYQDHRIYIGVDNEHHTKHNLKPPVPYVMNLNMINLPGCNIPNIDPFTPEVKKFYKKRLRLPCTGKASFLNVVNTTTIIVDHSKLWKLHKVKLSYCFYVAILRNEKVKNKPDDSVVFKQRNNSKFLHKVTIGDEFIRIDCYAKSKKSFHQEYRAFILPKPEVEARCDKAWEKNSGTEERLNVLVFGIDSVSKLNFLRHFNKTYPLLHSLRAIELHGYNKVQKNTLVNMIPLLTGKYLDAYWNSSMPPYFDHVDLLWKEYAEKGFRTLFAEDAPNIGMFNFRKRGFKYLPSDYYFRPAAIALEMSLLKKRSKQHCFGPRSEFSFILDWASDFVCYFKDKSYFSWVFLSRLTHELLNYAGYADGPSRDFLRKIFVDNKCMNNTLVIFMSDHGIRFGDILKTYVGKLEERLPFMFLLFPGWFLAKHPKFHKNLLINQHRLTTPFDIFETLKEVLELSTGVPVVGRPSPGTSLFREISPNRTCEDATISAHYCACHRYEPMSVNNSRVQKAAAVIVENINGLTKDVRNKCSELTLDKVISAQSNLPKPTVGEGSNIIMRFLIVIRLLPSMGEFEATVRYNQYGDSYAVIGDVTRSNKYANQSHCIMDHVLAHVCYCNDLRTRGNHI